MSAHLPILILEDRSGENMTRIRQPIHEPGFAAYCPVCGIGRDSEKEAVDCCSVLPPAYVKKARKKRCASSSLSSPSA